MYCQRMSLRMKSMTNSSENMYDESALFGSQKLKSRIVKQISHEFRTPLTSILGFAEILEEDVEINENQRIEYASYIRNEGLRLTKLVDDLIELDTLEQEQVDLQIKEHEIQETALSALMLVADLAHSKFIHISVDLPNKPVLMKFDHERIVQVLYQLLHNAVRFTKPDGLINLKVEAAETVVTISIQDSGPGISARDIPYLFNRFGKLYYSGKEIHGSGVGLAIVKHIVDQHNGNISVQSQVGEGSTFTIRIPILS
jgi:two-component system, OmpR family, sensor histidine kinase ResE